MERPSQQDYGESMDDRPRIHRTTGVVSTHRRERSSVRVNEEKLAAPPPSASSSAAAAGSGTAARPRGRDALPPVSGATIAGRRPSVAAPAPNEHSSSGPPPDASRDGGDGGGGGGGGGASSSSSSSSSAPPTRRRSIHSNQPGGEDSPAPTVQPDERPASASSFRPTSHGSSSRVPARGRADSITSAHHAYDGDFAGDAGGRLATAAGPYAPQPAGSGFGGATPREQQQLGWPTASHAPMHELGSHAPADAPGGRFAPDNPPRAAGASSHYYAPSSAPPPAGGGYDTAPPSARFLGDVDRGGTLADYMRQSALQRQQPLPPQPPPQRQPYDGGGGGGVQQLGEPAASEAQLAGGGVAPSPLLPMMVAVVHWGCRMAQGLLAGTALATVLFVANAAGGARSSTTAGRVLLALSAAPGLLPALRYATHVLAALSWLGAGWTYLEFRRARADAERALMGPAALQQLAAQSRGVSVCGGCCSCTTGGPQSATDLEAMQQQQQQQQHPQQQQQQPAALLGRAQPFSWGLQRLVGSINTAGAFMQRQAGMLSTLQPTAMGGALAAARGAAAQSMSAATLASGARAVSAFVAYSLLVATVWGCMASDSRLHVAAAAIATLESSAGSVASSAAMDAYVSDPFLCRHAEAWVTLAASRLVCAVVGWLLAASVAVSPSGVDRWAAAARVAAAAAAAAGGVGGGSEHDGGAEHLGGAPKYAPATPAASSAEFHDGGHRFMASSAGYTTTTRALGGAGGLGARSSGDALDEAPQS